MCPQKNIPRRKRKCFLFRRKHFLFRRGRDFGQFLCRLHCLISQTLPLLTKNINARVFLRSSPIRISTHSCQTVFFSVCETKHIANCTHRRFDKEISYIISFVSFSSLISTDFRNNSITIDGIEKSWTRVMRCIILKKD